MTIAPSHADIVAEDAAEFIRQNAYKLLNDCPEVRITKQPKWDADGSQHLAGPFEPTAIVGCEAEAEVSIPWPWVFQGEEVIAEAAKGFDEADMLARWCFKAILEHTEPPGGQFGIDEAHELTWKIARTGKAVFNAPDGLLTFPVRIVGER